VESGGQITWLLSSGNSTDNIGGTLGFQGYIIADCYFPAHGFAMITDGFGGTPQIAAGYLATILPNHEK
jgi:hypothetical protein